MEDKYNENDKYNMPLLKKKSSRRKKLQKLDKEFDLEKYKDKVFRDLGNRELQYNFIKEENDSTENLMLEYEIKYKKYVQEEITYNILLFINRIIMDSKSIPNEIRNKYPLHKILLNVVKTVLLNELELVYFSIYLDKLGWESQGFTLEDNLLLTALAVKMYLNDNFKFIIEYLNRTRNNYLSSLNRWLETKKDYNVLSIAAREINSRFNQLIKPSNPFCKNNFIDFNFVVDQILQMSIPYNDTKIHTSNHHTELSKFSFQNDLGTTTKHNQIQNSAAFNNTQNSMFSKFPQSAFLNQPKNLSTIQFENQMNIIREENQNLHSGNRRIKEEKGVAYNNDNNHEFTFNKNTDIVRSGSGIFGRQESDNLMVFMRDYSGLNFNNENISREQSNNIFADEHFFKNKSQSNVFQNLIHKYLKHLHSKLDDTEKNNYNQDKSDGDKQIQGQLKLSLPVNSDNSNLYNKYKIIKNANNAFDPNA